MFASDEEVKTTSRKYILDERYSSLENDQGCIAQVDSLTETILDEV